MPRPLHICCLPGFGDPIVGERWVDDLADACGPAAEVSAFDWPGLWTRWHEPVSFSRLVDELAALCGPDTVLVGHSLGGRVALQLAQDHVVAGAVALCSPTRLSINTGAAADAWRTRGARPTARVAPNGMAVTYELPVEFLDELNATLRAPAVPRCPTLLVFGDDDPKAAAADWSAVPGTPDVVTIERCGHMFMGDAASRATAVGAISRFVDCLG